ncbi:MAG: cytosolic protein [Candidatus Aenigmarchaeota archaeon]|nr:cytosolic protein [Candidatus Aenigmarchaeota archaeon]
MHCPNFQKNLEKCPCTYSGCDKKVICCECLRFHLSRNELPACCFSKEAEKTFDRSFEKFIEDNS